jgi:hypothetical protein
MQAEEKDTRQKKKKAKIRLQLRSVTKRNSRGHTNAYLISLHQHLQERTIS